MLARAAQGLGVMFIRQGRNPAMAMSLALGGLLVAAFSITSNRRDQWSR